MKKLFFLAVALPCFVFTAYSSEANVIPETGEDAQEVGNSIGKSNGHEWVDLGLPSGILWATCNVGASTPEGYGDYFAWGETKPKDYYNYRSHKYVQEEKATKYCIDIYDGYHDFRDYKINLEPEDDAAYVNWGGNWRMPTLFDQKELGKKCTWVWTTQAGVKGCKVTGPNGNSIFLPAAGYIIKDWSCEVGSNGSYWSSSCDELSFAKDDGVKCEERWRRRDIGRPVRAVCVPTIMPKTGGVNTGNINGHEWVDLGLPSGIKWATCNVGASTPEGYGDRFAWGETKPRSGDTKDWSTYKYGKDVHKMTKYCIHDSDGYNGFRDDKKTLDPSDDAAHVNWGGNWRIPTSVEQGELTGKCLWTWTTMNGVGGYKVTGPNGNSIFLPAAGYSYVKNEESFYWCSELHPDGSYCGLGFSFVPQKVYPYNWRYRHRAFFIRPVCK